MQRRARALSRVVIRMFSSWLGTAGLRERARARALSPSGWVLICEFLDYGAVSRVLGRALDCWGGQGLAPVATYEGVGNCPSVSGSHIVRLLPLGQG